MIYYWLLVILCLLLLFIISLVSSIILYAEQYTTLNIDMIYTILQVVSLWKELPLNSLLFYILLTAGYTILLTSLKVFISVSMMVGNIIDIYLLGVMVVIINWLLYSSYYGLLLISYLVYLFLTRIEVFLVLLFLLESFSIIFQSLTISNRLSINITAGSLLVSLLVVSVVLFSGYLLVVSYLFLFLISIHSFEILNCFIQLYIFSLLSIEYLMVFIYY